jgi:alkylation response protein AidB-like acyl-CoA dehydrogenase
MREKVTAAESAELDELCERLFEASSTLDSDDAWPADQLSWCGEAGVYEWFLAKKFGGQAWSDADITRGYLQLSAACLTTTFVITQYMGACRRIADSGNEAVISEYLPRLIAGESFATVGISHLTTSRRHLRQPVLRARDTSAGFVLDGYSPWVTGARFAELIVTGATMDDGRQILVALPTNLPGVEIMQPARLVGVSASQTGSVTCEAVEVRRDHLLAGPVENVMQQGVGAKTGGLQTTTLAVGLADAAIGFVENEGERRPALMEPAGALRVDWSELRNDLLEVAAGVEVCSNEQLRTRANSLALRAAQAALAAAKGTGYVVGHPAGRWCREALFFLVWSCPQPVMAANLCELAGISD